jgi:hypothetical protein
MSCTVVVPHPLLGDNDASIDRQEICNVTNLLTLGQRSLVDQANEAVTATKI